MGNTSVNSAKKTKGSSKPQEEKFQNETAAK
jgi:hypothetical protein